MSKVLTAKRSEKETLALINKPSSLTKEEIRVVNTAPTYCEIQKSIKQNGIGFIVVNRDRK